MLKLDHTISYTTFFLYNSCFVCQLLARLCHLNDTLISSQLLVKHNLMTNTSDNIFHGLSVVKLRNCFVLLFCIFQLFLFVIDVNKKPFLIMKKTATQATICDKVLETNLLNTSGFKSLHTHNHKNVSAKN